MSLFPQPSAVNARSYTPTTPLSNPYQLSQIPGMSINFPTMMQQSNTPPESILIGVHGFDSAKKFPTKPNQSVALHDMDADFEYIINTDVNNQPSYKFLEIKEISEEEYKQKYALAMNKKINPLTQEDINEIVKRLDKLEREVNANAKLSVQYDESAIANQSAVSESAASTPGSTDTAAVSVIEAKWGS